MVFEVWEKEIMVILLGEMGVKSKTKCCEKGGGKIDTEAGEFIVKELQNDVNALSWKMVTIFVFLNFKIQMILANRR